MKKMVKHNELTQGNYTEMLRLELADAMDHLGEGSVERIVVLIAELERLIPMSHEFDVEVSKQEFFLKYYKQGNKSVFQLKKQCR